MAAGRAVGRPDGDGAGDHGPADRAGGHRRDGPTLQRRTSPDDAERLIRDRFAQQERISFRVTVEKVHEHFD